MITSAEYWEEIAAIAKSVSKERDKHDVLHETLDGHNWVIYTAKAQRVVCLSPNDGYAVEQWGDALLDNGHINWSVLAFGAMYGDVCEHSDFDSEDS